MSVYEAASQLGFEGMVGKRGTSIYEPGLRSGAWLKVKSVQEQEFVVGGYTEGEGSRSKTFGGLLIGYYEGDTLRRWKRSITKYPPGERPRLR